jgi:hypothetical protein
LCKIFAPHNKYLKNLWNMEDFFDNVSKLCTKLC